MTSQTPLRRGRLVRPVRPVRMGLLRMVLAVLVALALVAALLALPGSVVDRMRSGTGAGAVPVAVAVGEVVNPDGGPTTLSMPVAVPEVPPRLDVVFHQDVTESFDDDLPVMRELVPLLLSDLAQRSDLAAGVASFGDRSGPAFGDPGEGEFYWLQAPLVAGADPAADAFRHLEVHSGGYDDPEAWLEALGRLLNDTGRLFRDDSRRVIVIATDTDPHLPGSPRYRGPARQEIERQLAELRVVVIGVTPNEQLLHDGVLAELAALTGGSVQRMDSDGVGLADAVRAGLRMVPVPVTPAADCPGVDVEFDPPVVTPPGTATTVTLTPEPELRGRRTCRLTLGSRTETVVVTGPTP